jgi:signal transduction histidine kinase
MTSVLDLFADQKRQWINIALKMSKSITPFIRDARILDHLFDNLLHVLHQGQVGGQVPLFVDTVRGLHASAPDLSTFEVVSRSLKTLTLMHNASRECAIVCLPNRSSERIIPQIDSLLIASMERCLLMMETDPSFNVRSDAWGAGQPQLLSVIAHELRTPLTLINAYAEMMEISLTDLEPEMQQMLEGINQGIDRLARIISNMLDTAIIHESEVYLEIEPIKVNGLILQTCAELTSAIETRGQSLMIKSFPSGSVSILGDQNRLRQALWNVLSNAIKYTPDGGEILVESTMRDDFVEIHIQDQGIGIPEQNKLSIFGEYQTLGDPRHHSSGEHTFKGGGLGLGLTLAKGIIEAHGGMIWVESPVNPNMPFPGTSFHLILPSTRQAAFQ